jgi:hypothetical protein
MRSTLRPTSTHDSAMSRDRRGHQIASKRGTITAGIAYVSFAVGWAVLALLATPEYQHVRYLESGLVGLGWSLIAVGCVYVSLTSKSPARWLRVALNVPVAVVAIALLPLSTVSLFDYYAGIAAYQREVLVCGHPPVLAWGGWGAHITLPSDPDYDRLKYSTQDPLILGNPVYFCTAADAEAHGFPMDS